MFFISQDDAFKFLIKKIDELEDKGEEIFCDISTFGYYLNINADGSDMNDQYPKITRQFIDRARNHNLRILVGLNDYDSNNDVCKQCPQCKTLHNSRLSRHQKTIEVLGLDGCVRFKEQMHWKYYRINEIILVGGMNLTESSYIDTVHLNECEDDVPKLQAWFNYNWNNSYFTPNDLNKFVIPMDKDYHIIEPPTDKQLSYIARLERETGITFDGESKADASKFIDLCVNMNKKK